MTRTYFAALVGLSLLLGSPTRVAAAENTDPRWLPWLGCWHLWEEQFDRSNERQPVDPRDEPVNGIAARVGRTSVCVAPADIGIGLTTSDGNETLIEHRIIADGTRRNIVEGACRGWERSEWSRDGHRLFTTTELACGEEPPRRVTGISLMASESSWLDIRYVDAGLYRQLEVRRYAPATSSAAGAEEAAAALTVEPSETRRARRETAQNPTLDDIVEASVKASARVVEALLVETQPDLDIDSHTLIALDDAGIDHGVIDLLVALSYPERFAVERRDRRGVWSSSPSRFRGFGGLYDPIWYSDLYPYYVTPFGSRYWSSGYNPYVYGAVGGPFVVLSSGDGDREQPAARAVQGRGYTRVVPRAANDGAVARRAPSRTGSSGGSRSRGQTGSSSGGSAATSGGYSNGGSGGNSDGGSGTGRRAVPRQ